MTTGASVYCELRQKKLNRPCSWQSSYSEGLEADGLDIIYMDKATFDSDGLTVYLKDGSTMQRNIFSRKVPWVVL